MEHRTTIIIMHITCYVNNIMIVFGREIDEKYSTRARTPRKSWKGREMFTFIFMTRTVRDCALS